MRGNEVDTIWLRAVLARVGGTATHLEPLPGGAVNRTWRVDRTSGPPIVLRIPVDERRADEYPVEAWAAPAAARAGVPTAEPLAHGVEAGVPFSLSAYVTPDERPVSRPWTWLGTYARALGTVPLDQAPASLWSRFGSDLAAAWAAHLAYGLDALGPADELLRDGAYREPSVIRAAIIHLAGATHDFGLAHGDLAPRNLLSRGPDEPPVLLDWGAAQTGPTPWTDARRVFEWCFVDGTITPREHDEFVRAAGLDVERARPELAMMTALHLVDVTRWASDQRPDLYREYVERCRHGLDVIERLSR